MNFTVSSNSTPAASRVRLAAMWPTELPIDMRTDGCGESSHHMRLRSEAREVIGDVLRGRVAQPASVSR